jgi:hypothetical protein
MELPTLLYCWWNIGLEGLCAWAAQQLRVIKTAHHPTLHADAVTRKHVPISWVPDEDCGKALRDKVVPTYKRSPFPGLMRTSHDKEHGERKLVCGKRELFP